MAWFKVDDKLWGHQKWVSTPPGARALWVTAGSWAADHLTDGFIPTHMLGTFGARAGDSRKLVEIGLWLRVDKGFQFRDWSDYQPSREHVFAEREAARQRQQAARDRARAKRASQRDDGVTFAVTSGDVTDLSRLPDPTRPDPTVVPTELQVTAPPTKPKATYPSDFIQFWEQYPKKAGKDAALRAWKAALKRAPFEEIVAGAKRYANDPGRDPQYTKDPATWLNGGHWADEPTFIPGRNRPTNGIREIPGAGGGMAMQI